MYITKKTITFLSELFYYRDHNETKILTDVIEDLSMSVIGGPTTYDPQEYDRRRQELVKYVPASQDELPHRRMSDSFDSALIPLGSDKRIRDRYATHLGGVRIGIMSFEMPTYLLQFFFDKVSINQISLSPKRSMLFAVISLIGSNSISIDIYFLWLMIP